ncbi:hypothetical protein [Bacillus subtilis]|nr:hypothetical protein [Bacillus subtilis]
MAAGKWVLTYMSKREIQVSSIAYKKPRVAGPWFFIPSCIFEVYA